MCCSEYLANKKNTLNDVALIQAPKGQGCPRCGGMVYAAEQVLAKGRVSVQQGAVHKFAKLPASGKEVA